MTASFFQHAKNVNITDSNFVGVQNISQTTRDSFNTHTTASYDSNNDNSRHYNGGRGSYNARDDNPPPGHRQSRMASNSDYAQGPHPYPPIPRGPSSYNDMHLAQGDIHNSFNTKHKIVNGSYNDNSKKSGVAMRGNPTPNRRQQSWMVDEEDEFSDEGPSRNRSPRGGMGAPITISPQSQRQSVLPDPRGSRRDNFPNLEGPRRGQESAYSSDMRMKRSKRNRQQGMEQSSIRASAPEGGFVAMPIPLIVDAAATLQPVRIQSAPLFHSQDVSMSGTPADAMPTPRSTRNDIASQSPLPIKAQKVKDGSHTSVKHRGPLRRLWISGRASLSRCFRY